jgi:ABC-type oligopeptide transport system substrate-binding subunit/DNA-binding SARP family transcriptional activator
VPALQLFLLGSLDIRHNGQQLPKPPTLKSQSLFAYLALHRRRPQPRERLADLFWGDRPEHKARRSLTTALWHIRRCLLPSDKDVLLSDVHSVQFDPQADLWLDVAEFESLLARRELSCLQSAVALYRGDFMDGFYDDWVLNERYRLETLFSEALAQLMMGLEAGGKMDGALAAGMRLLQHDPLREDAHRLTMRALCRLGQRNAALEQYHRCQQIVERELNVEPMVETTALYQAILDGRFEVGPAVDALPPERVSVEAILSSGQNPLDPVVRSVLVGRESEMAFLQACYKEARAGHGSLVLVHGEAGVGKTRLVEELADHLRWQGVRVLWGRCYEFERIVPYQPIGEALQAALSTIAPSDLTSFPSWVLGELARLVPELSETLPGIHPSSTVPLDQEQTYLFAGVARFLASLSAEGVLVLILDDLHWANESTLQMVHYLARHLADHQVLIVGTLRPEAVGPQSALGSFQQQLSREELVRLLSLAALSPEAVEALVVEMSGSGGAVAPLARRLYEETEGNPFFLIESIKALFEAGLVSLEGGAWRGDFARIARSELPLPAGVSQAVQARVRRLDGDARQVLHVAAVLGREFDLELLNAVWKRGEEATLEVLDALLRRRFIREGSGAMGRDYAFHHHKIREVVYAGIPSRRRQRLHARAGKAMETVYASDIEVVAGELAFHFTQGRQVGKELVSKAVRYLLLAGDQARLTYAHREAIEYYTQALALQKEQGEYESAGRTLMKLGLAHHTRFEFAQARKAFDEGFAHWQQAGKQEPLVSRPAAPHALRIRWRSPYTLDPAMCGDYVSSMVINQMFSGLVSTAPDLDVVPEVAQRWEISEGGRSYRFHLRPDARWSDGTPLTAHDFEFAWKRALDPAVSTDPSDLLAIKGAQAFYRKESADADCVGVWAIDDWTLDVELEEPVSHFLYLLANVDACPVPRHVVEAHGAAWARADTIVGNGPFRLEAWDSGECMTLVRNRLYAGTCRGNVDRVVLYFPEDLSVPLERYRQGDLDVLTLTDASVHEGDRIRRQFAAEYVSAPWLFTIYLGFVTSQPPFDDVRVRQALALGVNREELTNVVLRGMYTPGTGGWIPAGMPGHSSQIGLPYDPVQARQLTEAAGSALSTLDGLTVPPIDPLITQYLQAQWQENLGIQVTWKVADWPQFQERLQQAPPHMYILAGFASEPDPGGFVAADFVREGTRWANEAYGSLIEKARQVLDQGERLALLRKADQVLVREAPIVPLFYGRQHVLVKPWVSTFPISPLNRWYCKDTILEPH